MRETPYERAQRDPYFAGMREAIRVVPDPLCHNGYPFDPRWCDVCGEARRG